MLPDFPEAKDQARRAFMLALRAQITKHEPILGGTQHTVVHEGRSARLTRADQSTSEIAFQEASGEVTMEREQMRRVTVEQLLDHANTIAEQIAGQQVRLMFSRLTEAVEEVGNAVSAAVLGTKEAYLEMQRRLHVDFDPETLEPKHLTIVLHPDQVQSFMAQTTEWERDPAFNAEVKVIRAKQIEDWRARENRRQLVD